MIVIDRENSKGLWAYKLVDGIEIKMLEEGFSNRKGINHIYYVEDHKGMRYLFGGSRGQSYKQYIGYETNEDEVKRYDDIFNLYDSNNEFNFACDDMKDYIQ